MESAVKDPPAPGVEPSEQAPARARRGLVKAAIVSMRPAEWIKNLLVFAGLLFSSKFHQFDAIAAATVTFVAFCAISSAGYLINDAHDAELDRQHPTKRKRPIASGELSVSAAIALATVLFWGALALGLTQGLLVDAIVLAYAAG